MELTIDILLPHSSPLHQQGTASCWAFSACSFWETEHAIASGMTTVDTQISPWYLARLRIELLSKAMIEGNLPGNKFPVGDMVPTAGVLAKEFGLVSLAQYDSMKAIGKSYRTMMRKLRIASLAGRHLPFCHRLALSYIEKVLDAGFGPKPKTEPLPVEQMRGFASQYDQPFNTEFVLNVPDNYRKFKVHNLPIEELLSFMFQTLESGHSLIWQGQLRQGFSMKKGLAILPPDMIASEGLRQQRQASGQLTDDHAMHIVGLAHDAQGSRYFIAKNSVGDAGPYHGLIYMQEDYMRMKTVAVFVR